MRTPPKGGVFVILSYTLASVLAFNDHIQSRTPQATGVFMVFKRTVILSVALSLFTSASGFAVTRSWIGSAGANWSNTANWSPSGTPAPSDSLLFPAGAATIAMTNDLPAGTTVGLMTFNDSYTLNGNPLTLSADFNGSTTVGILCNVDLKLANSLHLRGSNIFNGAIDVNGQTLTIDPYNTVVNGAVNGSGAIVITGSGVQMTNGGTFTGTVSGADLDFQGSMSGANVTTTHLSGNGTLGTVNGGRLTPGGWHPGYGFDPNNVGVLHTKTLTASGLSIDLKPSASSDQVQVTGTVNISGATLQVTIASGALQVGQAFTIIDNDGSDPVNGTFAGLPEGATLSFGTSTLAISYLGGDGNDVVLSVLADTSSVLTQTVTETKVGEPWTRTTSVTSAAGVPTGFVSFPADGIILGTAAVVNGVASLTIAPATAGTRRVTATFLGTGMFADSVSPVLSHTVNRGQTKIALAADHQNSVYGQLVRLTATLSVLAPAAGQPGGSVTILADGTAIGTVPVVNGTATFESASLHAGLRTITATYSGDTNFDGSTASAIQQSIAKAQTRVDASTRSVLIGASAAVEVFVSVPARSDLVPSGNVTISEDGVLLDTLPLARAAASFALSPLSTGDHRLLVSFSGDSDFESSSATVIQTVGVAAISVHGTRVDEGN